MISEAALIRVGFNEKKAAELWNQWDSMTDDDLFHREGHVSPGGDGEELPFIDYITGIFDQSDAWAMSIRNGEHVWSLTEFLKMSRMLSWIPFLIPCVSTAHAQNGLEILLNNGMLGSKTYGEHHRNVKGPFSGLLPVPEIQKPIATRRVQTVPRPLRLILQHIRNAHYRPCKVEGLRVLQFFTGHRIRPAPWDFSMLMERFKIYKPSAVYLPLISVV